VEALPRHVSNLLEPVLAEAGDPKVESEGTAIWALASLDRNPFPAVLVSLLSYAVAPFIGKT
jgi:hypothetical protein